MIARALENTLVDRGGQLLPPYVFQLVPDFSFGYQSEDQLAFLNNGSIVRQQSHRDLLEWGFGFRIGLPWETQVGFRVPFDLNYGTATFGGTEYIQQQSRRSWRCLLDAAEAGVARKGLDSRFAGEPELHGGHWQY